MEKLKQRWNIKSNIQLFVILLVFAITGSSAAKLAGPLMELLTLRQETTNPWIYWMLRIVLIFPIYQVLLVFFGWVFGQFQFFWGFEKKMLKRIGIKLK
ncbi:hypothetical protein SAMN04487906_2510 [Zhouia amylolytica]|uniref:DUF6787 domain-containing protein n=2 Tax=Zhouia amylolytica TaxID=376730 RepID=W2UN38_9FLAO|nr:DUF6787 family protein [Zhouia amylolytica]ETN95413.1 hypothetical protein P278_11350 [Zhouia amylolytica AD3]MCQ0112737.1 diacylglyceryl transferase [Zhouia amylolytica]SFT01453.1 hypothetical protein SAMN04487906_2510 [Zhouia amylolytica]